jgi:hypothetical protein
MICENRNDPPPQPRGKIEPELAEELVHVPSQVGIFKDLGRKLGKVTLPDPEFIFMIHEWIMSNLEVVTIMYEYDMVDAMAGRTDISLQAKSGHDWLCVSILHGVKLHHQLKLHFGKQKHTHKKNQ